MTVCPNCGKENVEDAVFCAYCGTSLSTKPPSEERRFLTILFADLVGFTAESDEADPEDVRARLVPYHQRVREEIEAFDGTVEKLIGDGVMAVFGVPAAHEDDPERAVRAALRIQTAVDELNEEDKEVIDISTRTGDLSPHIRWGTLICAVDGEPATLTVYKGTGEEAFFLPFADTTSGKESYEAGRYLDVVPSGPDSFQIGRAHV